MTTTDERRKVKLDGKLYKALLQVARKHDINPDDIVDMGVRHALLALEQPVEHSTCRALR